MMRQLARDWPTDCKPPVTRDRTAVPFVTFKPPVAALTSINVVVVQLSTYFVKNLGDDSTSLFVTPSFQ